MKPIKDPIEVESSIGNTRRIVRASDYEKKPAGRMAVGYLYRSEHGSFRIVLEEVETDETDQRS